MSDKYIPRLKALYNDEIVKNLEKDLEKVSKEAIEQIIDKKYDTQLKERGIKDITLLGIAFFGKILKVSHK